MCPLNSFCENKTGRLSHKLYLENHKYGKHFKIINPRALTYNPPARKSEQKRMSIKINDFILPYSNNFSTNNITIEFAFIFFFYSETVFKLAVFCLFFIWHFSEVVFTLLDENLL